MQMTIGGFYIRFLKDLGDEIAYLKLNAAGRPIGGVRIISKEELKKKFPPPGLVLKGISQKDNVTRMTWAKKG